MSLTRRSSDLGSVTNCWGENLLGDDVECEDLEDPDGYYKAFGCKKISSDEDIGVSLKKAKKDFFGLVRTHHQEKTAFENLVTLNIMGSAYADRIIYDRKGEEIRIKFTTVFEERYPDSTFAQRDTDINSKLNRP